MNIDTQIKSIQDTINMLTQLNNEYKLHYSKGSQQRVFIRSTITGLRSELERLQECKLSVNNDAVQRSEDIHRSITEFYTALLNIQQLPIHYTKQEVNKVLFNDAAIIAIDRDSKHLLSYIVLSKFK